MSTYLRVQKISNSLYTNKITNTLDELIDLRYPIEKGYHLHLNIIILAKIIYLKRISPLKDVNIVSWPNKLTNHLISKNDWTKTLKNFGKNVAMQLGRNKTEPGSVHSSIENVFRH